MSETTQILIDERTAAKALSMSPSALVRLRKAGVVPGWRKLGNLVRYDPVALREWAARTGKVEGRKTENADNGCRKETTALTVLP